MADLASFQYGRDDEEGEYSMVDMCSDEDDPSGAVSPDHDYDLENIVIDTALKSYCHW